MIFIRLLDSKKSNFHYDVQNYNRIIHKTKQRINWKSLEIKEEYNDDKNGQEILIKKIEKRKKNSNLSNNGVKCEWGRR